MAPPDSGLLDGLLDQSFRECIPLQVSLELTVNCNLRCGHCYNLDRSVPIRPPAPPLAFDEILRLLDDLRAAGTLFLSLTGGEPMVHPRFWDVLDEASARHFAVSLLTNGTLLDNEACDRLARHAGIHQVSLSLYGARPGTHDSVTEVDGSFGRTIEGARRLKERDLRVSLKFLVLQANAPEAAGMIALADEEGLPYSVDPALTPRYDGTEAPIEDRVDTATLEALYRGPLRRLLPEEIPDSGEGGPLCFCGRSTAAVSESGDVWPCVAVPQRAGNIREQRFPKIWAASPALRRIRDLRPSDFRDCAPCPHKAVCSGCPGAPLLLHGDYTGVDPWICRQAEAVRRVLG